jgi:predicted nucleic acid-binding protein
MVFIHFQQDSAIFLRFFCSSGMDFAEALALAAAEDCKAFITFDRDFVTAARTLALPRAGGLTDGQPILRLARLG